MKRPGMLIAFLILAAVAIASAVYFYMDFAEGPDAAPAPVQTGRVDIGGPFALTDQEGRPVTDADLRGRYALVYFGYTSCPDMCPLGLQRMTEALERLPADVAAKVLPVFVTVDPARDTPEVLREYAAAFHPRLLALGGDQAAVDAALKAYRVYARKGDAQADGGYPVDHTTITYLMDPAGEYAAHFSHGATPEEMAERIAAVVAEGPATS